MADVMLGDAQEEHPSYELPAEVGRDTSSELPPEPVAGTEPEPGQPGTPAAPTAGAPATPPAAHAAPAAPAAPASPDPVLEHPAFKALMLQNQRLAALIERQQPPQPAAPAAPAAPERPQADVELEERMIQRIPWLAGVREFFANADRLEQLDRLAAAAPQVQETFATHAEQTADFAFNRVVDVFARARGVARETLSEAAQGRIVRQFVEETRANPVLAKRFALGDVRVVDEVLRDVLDTYGLQFPADQPVAGAPAAPAAPAPAVVPQQVVGIAQRVASAQNLPRAGAVSGAPAPVTPAAGGGEDDDEAIHGRGWAALQAARRGA